MLHARYIGGFPGTVAMADAIRTAVSNALVSTAVETYMDSVSDFRRVDLRDLNTINQPVIESAEVPLPGTALGAGMPGEVAAVLTEHTGLTGQANRGRIYIPNWAVTAATSGDLINATLATALNNFGPLLRNAINAQNLFMCLAHPPRAAYTGSTGRQHPARAAETVDVTTVFLRDSFWDTQRRRGRKA